MKKIKILGVIPARGGSKGIPRKNLAPLAGKPLLAFTLEAAKSAKTLDRFVVSTNDPAIAEFSLKSGVNVILRPDDLSDDFATTQSVLIHAVEELKKKDYNPDAVMTLQPTSPLRRGEHIDKAARLFMKDKKADSLVSCVKVPLAFHPSSLMKINSKGYLECLERKTSTTRRQDKAPTFARNGAAIYITKTKRLKEYIFGGRCILFLMEEKESIDINEPIDLVNANNILNQIENKAS